MCMWKHAYKIYRHVSECTVMLNVQVIKWADIEHYIKKTIITSKNWRTLKVWKTVSTHKCNKEKSLIKWETSLVITLFSVIPESLSRAENSFVLISWRCHSLEQRKQSSQRCSVVNIQSPLYKVPFLVASCRENRDLFVFSYNKHKYTFCLTLSF